MRQLKPAMFPDVRTRADSFQRRIGQRSASFSRKMAKDPEKAWNTFSHGGEDRRGECT
jgi:hypothetical protein